MKIKVSILMKASILALVAGSVSAAEYCDGPLVNRDYCNDAECIND